MKRKKLLSILLALALVLSLMPTAALADMAENGPETVTFTFTRDANYNSYVVYNGTNYQLNGDTINWNSGTVTIGDITFTARFPGSNTDRVSEMSPSYPEHDEYMYLLNFNYDVTMTFHCVKNYITHVKVYRYDNNISDYDNQAKDCTLTCAKGIYRIDVSLSRKATVSTYNIYYVLNGGTNSASNPATYTDDRATALYDASRTGHIFEGWYDNPGFSGTAITSIPVYSEGDKTFYAKWKCDIDGLTYDDANGWYVIDSAAALNALAAYSTNNNCSGKTFRQTADIALSGTFSGIGSGSNPFNGAYDGGAHVITGLYMKKYQNYMGFFRKTGSNAVIENVRLIQPYVSSANSDGSSASNGTGALIGYMDHSTVRNCIVIDPEVIGNSDSTGSIVGWMYYGDVTGCSHYFSGSTLPAVGRDGGSVTATRLRTLTLPAGVSASGDGVVFSYQGAIYCGENESVTLTLSPAAGYRVSAFTVNGNNMLGSLTNNAYTFSMPASDVTVTATFTREEYSITYDLDGGTNPAQNPSSYNVDSADITLLDPTRAGYAFLGWTGSNGSVPQKAVAIPHGSTGDKTYTANWMPDFWGINDGNNGSAAHPYLIGSEEGLRYLATYVNSGKNASGLNFLQTADIALSGTFTPIGGQNDGYNSTPFSGVYNGNGYTVTGLNVSVSSPYAGLFGYLENGTVRNLTVVNPTVTASYSNTRYAGGIVGVSRGYIENCRVIDPTLSATYCGAICGGITQAGRTVSDCYYHAADNVAAVGVNTLNVSVTGGRTYTITTADGITASAASVFSYDEIRYYAQGVAVTLGHVDRAGYTFAYASNDAVIADGGFTMPAKDVTVTAVYTPIVYGVVYHAGEGATFSTEKNAYTVESPDITLDQPSKTGYTFSGWYANASLTGDALAVIATGSTGDLELWAKWTPNTYTVHFESNTNLANGSMADQTFTYDQEPTALSALAFSVTIGEFMYWTTEADGTGDVYADGAEIRNLTDVQGAVITLYAQWHLMHDINYDVNIFLCYPVNDPQRPYHAYASETVKVTIREYTHEYTITIYTGDGETVAFDTDTMTFVMPDGDVWVTYTSVKNIAYTTILLDDFETWEDAVYLYDADNPTITPVVTVIDDETVLSEGVDYTLEITDNTGSPDRAVEATVKITGMGDYIGTNTKTFHITPFNIANCEIKGKLETYDDGYGIYYPLTENVEVWYGETQLECNVDYEIDVEEPDSGEFEVGQTYQATVRGINSWGGTQTFTFTVIELTHTVVFDANGGTGEMADDTVAGGKRYTLPACGFTAPAGMEFSHWVASCEPDAEKQPGDYFTAPNIWSPSDVQTITVTAQWKISDGFYLIGPDWTVSAIDAGEKFAVNPGNGNEYMLSTTLAENDEIKVVHVTNNVIDAWYPDGEDTQYRVDAAHAGSVNIYFQTTYNNGWSEFGGYFYIETLAEPEFKTQSLTLDGKIGVNFYMDLSMLSAEDLADTEKTYMTFDISGKGTVSSDPVPVSENQMNSKGTYYGFTCYVNSIQMADTITATFHYGDGLTVKKTYSIEEYIDSFDGYASQFDSETVSLVHALADYGHYVQLFLEDAKGLPLGYADDQYAPMNRYYTREYDPSGYIASVLAEDYAVSACNDDPNIKSLTFSVVLDSETALRLICKPVSGFKKDLTVLDDDNLPHTVKLQSGRWTFEIPNIPAHQLGRTYNVNAFTGEREGGVLPPSASIAFSAMSYTLMMLNSSSEPVQYAGNAIYYYWQAAVAYKNTH